MVVFGNGVFGQRPDETTTVIATYRVGGGAVGNVAAETLIQPRPLPGKSIAWLVDVTNPLPASGGRDLESRDHARRLAPAIFQKPLVAVTEADYRAAALEFTLAGRKPIQNAKANFRWTGSWLTLTLSIDPRGSEGSIDQLRGPLLAYLDTRRLAGYDLEIIGALYVPVDLALEFCLKPGFIPANVQQAIELALSSGELPGGKKGLFHPDNFSFGDNLYVSRIFEAVMSVPGVESAQITRLSKLHAAFPDRDRDRNLQQGFLAVGADQIIRLDNDRNFPENGTLFVSAKGVSD
jgi:predicted phage baseplate assembly protein